MITKTKSAKVTPTVTFIAGIIVFIGGIVLEALKLTDGNTVLLAGLGLLVGGQFGKENQTHKKLDSVQGKLGNVQGEVHQLHNGGLTKAVNDAINNNPNIAHSQDMRRIPPE